jgi:hypothetical protein
MNLYCNSLLILKLTSVSTVKLKGIVSKLVSTATELISPEDGNVVAKCVVNMIKIDILFYEIRFLCGFIFLQEDDVTSYVHSGCTFFSVDYKFAIHLYLFSINDSVFQPFMEACLSSETKFIQTAFDKTEVFNI